MQLNSEGLITLERSAQLKPYQPRSVIAREYLTDNELLSSTKYPAFFDIELYPNYFLCTFKINGKFICLECGEDKSFNPKLLSWIMFSYRTVGFNSIKYDLLILWLAYHRQDVTTLKDASNDIILRGIRDYELKRVYNFQTFKTNHVDLIEVAPLKGSLKLYMARLHAPRIQELPFPDTLFLTEDQQEIVKQYNFNDLDGTELLFNFMKERLELREALGNEYHEDLMSKSDAQIAEIVLSKEVGKINGSRPKRSEIDSGTVYRYSIPSYIQFQSSELNVILGKIKTAKFVVNNSGKIELPEALNGSIKIGNASYRLGIGGLHSSEKNCCYKSSSILRIADRDVSSYYPRIITTLGLFPQSMGLAFLEAYNKIIDVRLEAKKNKVFSRDKGLKIVINGTSGKFSDYYSTLYSPDLTIQVTVTGQLALLMLIEMLELIGVTVISANTDGIVMLIDEGVEKTALERIKLWEQKTGFETEETEYKSYYARDVNSYFAVKLNGDVKKKGPYSEVGSQSGTKLDTNPIVLICSDAVEALIAKDIPIEQTILNCKDLTRFVAVRQAKAPGAHKNGEYLGKVLRWYYAKGETGCIQTVQANNKVADSDGAKPCLDMPAEFPTDIDYSWYIKHTTEILYDIGYYHKPKQIEFF